MSQLQAQLRKFAASSTKAKQPKGTRASLLFDGRKAAETDLETIYSLGVNGLAELFTHRCGFLCVCRERAVGGRAGNVLLSESAGA